MDSKLSPEAREMVADRMVAGEDYRVVAVRFGISHSLAYRMRDRYYRRDRDGVWKRRPETEGRGQLSVSQLRGTDGGAAHAKRGIGGATRAPVPAKSVPRALLDHRVSERLGALGRERGAPREDWCTREGARELARRIARYWQSRGQIVAARLTSELGADEAKIAFGESAAIWGVRTDLVGGLPRRWRRER